jgi:hypothetical protein
MSIEPERIQDEAIPVRLRVSNLYQDHRPLVSVNKQAPLQVEQTQFESNIQRALEALPTPDINTLAYERMKNRWMKRGIWNEPWGVLPGMSWKHEQATEEILPQELITSPPSLPSGPSFPQESNMANRSILTLDDMLAAVFVQQVRREITDRPINKQLAAS